jgi:hypothetical protein
MKNQQNTAPAPSPPQKKLLKHKNTSRLLGDKDFVNKLEIMIGRVLHPKRLGHKKKEISDHKQRQLF